MPVDLSFDDIMRRAGELLGDKVAYYHPERFFWSFNVLVPPDYSETLERALENNQIEHLFAPNTLSFDLSDDTLRVGDDTPHRLPPGRTDTGYLSVAARNLIEGSESSELKGRTYVREEPLFNKIRVFHGHNSDQPCFTNSFCHVEEYRPTGGEHPAFIRFFYEKWPQYK